MKKIFFNFILPLAATISIIFFAHFVNAADYADDQKSDGIVAHGGSVASTTRVFIQDPVDTDIVTYQTNQELVTSVLGATHDTSTELDALYEGELNDSAGLAAALSDETGTGAAVLANSPTLVTPNLGTPSALTLTNATGLPTILATDSGNADATWYPIIADAATGEQAMQTDSGLTYNPSTNVLTASGGYGVGSGATPTILFQDSDAPGSDKDVGWIEFGYVDGADGSENSDFWIEIIQGGSENTEILRFDESDDRWEIPTGKHFALGTTQWDNGSDAIDGEVIADDTIDDDSLDFADITLDDFVSAESDYISVATDDTFDFTRNDSGTVTITASDDDATAALTVLPGGAAALTLGGASTTTVSITTDGGTATIDGTTITAAAANNPYIVLDDDDDADFYIINDDAGQEIEFSTDSTVSQNNLATLSEAGTFTTTAGVTVGTLLALTPQNLSVTTEADITLTGSLLLVTGDDDEDNDTIDLQDGTVTGQKLTIVGVAAIDGTDTITVAMTDTTCTGCLTVLLDEIGDTWELVWTGSTWATTANSEVP